MRETQRLLGLIVAAGIAGPAFADGWVTFVNETSLRMPSNLCFPSTSTADPEEKDYAWGDVDNDGDIDLVCVRKQPFTSTGKKPNVLFMNEGTAEGHAMNGIFADRTAQYASASDVPGDQGFLTPTNDRDVVLVDLDLDGWLDMVTATTLTDNQAKHLSHPRVYMNLGEIDGVWQGFRYEDARIPQMHPTAGPRFCSVAAGDVTGDGYPDLYFGDYDSGGAQIFDYNNRLLINDGTGNFTDQSTSRMDSTMLLSAFGAASVIADMNNDGVNDVVKQTSLNPPQHVAVTYNNPTSEGVFQYYDVVYELAGYFVYVGELNNDGLLDMVVVDDGTDRYLLGTGLDAQGRVDYLTKALPSGPSAGFGGNAYIDDLNKDGFNDIIVTDVDVDIAGCSRRMQIYRNMGNLPSPDFQEQGEVVPFAMSSGTHDVGVFDINGDGWLDLVVGRCNSTEIWMNDPPIGVSFGYPNGLPAFVQPDQAFDLDIQLGVIGEGTIEPNSLQVFAAIGNGAFAPVAVQSLGGDLYRATLPGAACTEAIRFYSSANIDGGGTYRDPRNAPTEFYSALSAEGTEVTFVDQIEGDVSAWTVYSSNLTSGAWQQAEPNGTQNNGELAAPPGDATNGAGNVLCFVTENGPAGGGAASNDVDGGPTYLESPMIDLSDSDATITYSRWFYCDDEGGAGADQLLVQVSNDGGQTWVAVPSQTTSGTGSAWQQSYFRVGDFVTPTAQIKVRFFTSDNPNNSVTEAGIDNFQVEEILCGNACPADLDASGDVGFGDLLTLLGAWGACDACPADLDGSGDVGFNDLLTLLGVWGPCP